MTHHKQQGLPVSTNDLLAMIGEQAVEIRILRNQIDQMAGVISKSQKSAEAPGEDKEKCKKSKE